MEPVNPTEQQVLRNLAAAMKMQESGLNPNPARPGVTDLHILRAVLGKPMGGPTPVSSSLRKAG